MTSSTRLGRRLERHLRYAERCARVGGTAGGRDCLAWEPGPAAYRAYDRWCRERSRNARQWWRRTLPKPRARLRVATGGTHPVAAAK